MHVWHAALFWIGNDSVHREFPPPQKGGTDKNHRCSQPGTQEGLFGDALCLTTSLPPFVFGDHENSVIHIKDEAYPSLTGLSVVIINISEMNPKQHMYFLHH